MPHKDELYDRINLRVPKDKKVKKLAKKRGHKSPAPYVNALIAEDVKRNGGV